MSSLIHAEDLVKTYHVGEVDIRALRGVTVDVQAGEFIALTGPSGSGKSTFMHLVGCLDRPTSGRYLLSGRDVSSLDKRELARVRNRDIGFVFQAFNLLPRTTALEQVELPMLYGQKLSGGQQQRGAVARALATRPKIVFADEPTGNLDSRAGAEILGFMAAAVRDMGQTVVMVTHDPVAASYADSVIFLADGRVAGHLESPTAQTVLDTLKGLKG